MKKYIFLISILITSLKADGYYMGKCVSSIESFDSTSTFTVNYSGNWSSFETSNISVLRDILPTWGLFEYDSLYAICKTKTLGNQTSNNPLNISDETYQLLSGLTGLLTGFLLSFIILKRV